MKRFKNTVLKGYNDKPIVTRIRGEDGQITDEKDLKLSNAMWMILNSAPLKTQNDSIQGARLATALDEAEKNGYVELEEGVHDWLKPIAEQATPQLFRINGKIVYDIVAEGFEKEKEPRVKKGRPEEGKAEEGQNEENEGE